MAPKKQTHAQAISAATAALTAVIQPKPKKTKKPATAPAGAVAKKKKATSSSKVMRQALANIATAVNAALVKCK